MIFVRTVVLSTFKQTFSNHLKSWTIPNIEKIVFIQITQCIFTQSIITTQRNLPCRSYNNLSGRSERAFLIILSVAQLLALAIVWLPILLILWVLKRFTRCRKYLSNIPLTLLSILIGTIVYFLVSDSFASDSDYIRIGVKNINTFLWLLFVISGSLLLRVNSERLNMSGRIYVPTLIISFVIIILRNIFIPDIVLNILLTPVLVIVVLWQLATCLQVRNKVTRADSLLGWVSLSIYVITLLLSFFGYCFAALQYLVWWFFLLSALLTVFCFSTLLDPSE